MLRTIPAAWVSGASYTQDTSLVTYRGIIFQALTTHNGVTTDPLEDTTNWKVNGIYRIQDIYSLAEAVKIAVNRNVPQINNSVWMYIQMMEASIATRLRVPAQLTRTVQTVVQMTEDGESYIEMPDSTLQIENIRVMNPDGVGGDDGDFNSLLYQGRYEINEANYYEYQLIKQRYDSDIDFFDAVSSTQFRSMVYWNDGRRAYFAPTLSAGTQVEVVYYAELNPLGYPILLTNADGDAVNDAGQTQAQWIAAGNTAATFVQGSGIQETNWFVQAGPRMCLYGTIMTMEQFLKDDDRWPLFQQQFLQAEAEIQELIDKFESKRSSTQYFRSSYPI